MKENNHYTLCKSKLGQELVYVNYQVPEGFKFKPKNQLNYNGVKVNEMVVINPSFIEKVLKRKIKKKLDIYLQFLIRLLDEGTEEPTSFKHALNDLERYRRTIINKYRHYLDEKYIKLLLKKLDVLERELKNKLIICINKQSIDDEYENERKRGR